jgi:predicted exporter
MFARLALRRPRAVAAALLLITLLIAALGLPPRIDGDLLNLIPPDDPSAIALQALRDAPGGDGIAIVAFPEGTDLAAAAAALEATPSVRRAFHAPEPDLARRLAALQLDPQAVSDLTVRIQGAMAVPSPLLQARLLSGELLPKPASIYPPGIVVVIPAGPSTDALFCEALLADLEAAAPNATGIDGSHIAVARTGREATADLLSTSGVSLLLVVGILGVMLRSVRAVIALLPPLLLAVVVSLSLVQLINGALNTYTSMGTAILFGLGIDFGIHLMARYRELRGAGDTPEEAVIAAWAEVGPPCVTAALTSAAGFAALMLADFRGISQLGGALALGVMVCLGFMFLLLPILLVRLDPGPVPMPTAEASGGARGMAGLLVLGLLLTALAGTLWPKLTVEYDTSALRNEGFAWAELSEPQRALREQAFPPVVVPVTSPQARAEEHDRLTALVEQGALPHVRGVLSVETLLPADQPERLAALSKLAALHEDPRAATLPAPVREALADLHATDLSVLSEEELPEALRILLGVGSPRVMLLLQGNMRDLRASHELKQELDGVVTGAASEFLTHAILYNLITEDLRRFSLAALAAVLLLVALDLRRVRLVIVAVVGLLGGIVWAGGGMAAADIRINIANIVALPILLGLGVDVVIHLLHRLEATGDVGVALRTSGYAALTSTLTTLAAFIALVAADNRGIRSTGEVISLGMTMVFLATILLVPAGWAVLRRAPRTG